MLYADYTLEEVSRHSAKSNGLWIIIKDSVYDVTEYINEHPGGAELLLEYAGRDATSGFNDSGHSSDATNLMKPYRIGQLIESDRRGRTERRKRDIEGNSSKRKHWRMFFPLIRSCT